MTTPIENVTLDYYKTNVGVFLRNTFGSHWSTLSLSMFKFNGIEFPNVLVGGNFFHLKGLDEITKVEKRKSSTNKHIGYKIREDIPQIIGPIKPFYSLEEVSQTWNDDLDKTEYGNIEFSTVRSLYTEAYETVPESWVGCSVTHNSLGTLIVENYEQPEKMQIKLHAAENFGSNKTDTVDLSSIVCYADFERMLTPGFMLHTRPCSLTSDQVYKIVRAHIKDNINPRAAQITSDYDFCFTVKRKVNHKPVTTRSEIKKQNGRSYATPKFRSNTKTHDLVEIFEMTNASNRYNGYTIIQGWTADNLIDMQDQVGHYLILLMSEINKEAMQCEHCNGVGVIVKGVGTNER